MRMYIIVLVIFLILISSVISSVTLRQGETYETSGKQIIVENIKEDMIVINVDGVKKIINVGEQKEVNGVDILLESTFYVDEPGERTASVVMAVAFYCGDNNCDTNQNETKENCCEDCGCNSGYTCQDGVCKTESQVQQEQQEEEEKSIDKCSSNADCDDNDPLTEDLCKSYPGKPKKCLNIPPICKTDIECDDQDSCTVDRCVNNDCISTEVPDYASCSEKQEVQEKKQETAPETEKRSEEATEQVGEFVEEEKNIFSKIISFLFGWLK
jgi:hypothetical protein